MKRDGLDSGMRWMAAGTYVYTGAQWGVLVVLARFTSPTDVGHYTLALAVTAPVFLLGGLNLRVAVATDVTGEYAFRDYLAVTVLAIPIELAVVVAVPLVFAIPGDATPLLGVVAVSKAFEAVGLVVYGLQQRLDRLDRVAVSLTLRGVGGLAAFMVAVASTRDVVAGAIALACVWAAVLVAYDLPHAIASEPSAGGMARLLPLIRRASPLGIDAGVTSLMNNLPRYAVQAQLGSAALGVFGVIAYAIQLVLVAGGSLGNVILPRLAHHYASGDRASYFALLRRSAVIGAGIGIASVAAAALFGAAALRLAFGSAYARVDLLIVAMIVAAVALQFRFLGRGIQAARRFGAYLATDAVAVVVAALTLLVAVPAWGLIGALIALGAGHASGAVVSVWAVARIGPPRRNDASIGSEPPTITS